LDALLAADKGRGALGALWALSQIDARLDRVETDIHAIKTKIVI
jgi:hypothetical protein